MGEGVRLGGPVVPAASLVATSIPTGYNSVMEPSRLGPYLIHQRLGRGGMGAVYEAEDTGTGRRVAVKILAAHFGDDEPLRRRFAAEIEALKRLRHPGIVELLAFGEEDGQPYFAMELVPGKSLEHLLRAGRRFGWRPVVQVAAEIAKALKAAHDAGCVHRDLKPANLLFTEDDAGRVGVKLADFGIARLFGDAGQTQAGSVVGTAEYMAPEQAAGLAVDHRADLYALGLVMFAMLTGRPPFQGGQPLEVLGRQRRERPPRVSTLVPDVPPALDDLIDRLLAKEPSARPPSALVVARQLSAIDAAAANVAGGGLPGQGKTTAADAVTREVRSDTHTGGAAEVDLFAPTRDIPGPRAAGTRRGAAPGQATRNEDGPEVDFAGRETTPEFGREGDRPRPRNEYIDVEEERRRRTARETRWRRWEFGLRALAATALAAAVGLVGWWTLRSPTADELHAKIRALVEAGRDPLDGKKDAFDLIGRFLDRHPDDARGDELRGYRRDVEVDRLRRRVELRERRNQEPHLRVEREYRVALASRQSDPQAALTALEAILVMPPEIRFAAVNPRFEEDELLRDRGVWDDLVKRKIAEMRRLDAVEQRVERQDASRRE